MAAREELPSASVGAGPPRRLPPRDGPSADGHPDHLRRHPVRYLGLSLLEGLSISQDSNGLGQHKTYSMPPPNPKIFSTFPSPIHNFISTPFPRLSKIHRPHGHPTSLETPDARDFRSVPRGRDRTSKPTMKTNKEKPTGKAQKSTPDFESFPGKNFVSICHISLSFFPFPQKNKNANLLKGGPKKT